MTRLNAYWGRTTDTLSAFLLLLAVMLAGGYGPLAQATPVPAASQSPTDAGNGEHRSAPVVAKQQMLAGETRDTKAAPWDDGKPKAFLPSNGFDLAAPDAGVGYAVQIVALAPSITASGFDARAPPAKS